jgi:excisionase family DNA binding protein
MNTALLIATILVGASALVLACTSFVFFWVYRLGLHSGREHAAREVMRIVIRDSDRVLSVENASRADATRFFDSLVEGAGESKGASVRDSLLTPEEVAATFRVDPETVAQWADAGKLTPINTLGGHRRYRESQVRTLLKRTTTDTADPTDG